MASTRPNGSVTKSQKKRATRSFTESHGRSIFENHDDWKMLFADSSFGGKTMTIKEMRAWRLAMKRAIKKCGSFKFTNGDFTEE